MNESGLNSPRYQALLQLLRTAETIWNGSRVFFARWDISPSQFNILNLLRDHPAGCTQIELSRLLIMHRSNITGLVDRLEARNLLSRRPIPDDRRAYNVALTAKGRALLNQILPDYYQTAEKIWGSFSPARAREISTDLAALADQVNQAMNNGFLSQKS